MTTDTASGTHPVARMPGSKRLTKTLPTFRAELRRPFPWCGHPSGAGASGEEGG
ncbi:hypothetical protein ACFWWM_16540 [Streptomyces sp. NPDC058682]|uniref:hypothetical protein n=1 Tax=unclassified Streptomyces TaxID=2593676 RepID=UPI00224DBEC1|nr:hypothetical protein [Streptomyces sp. NBC_01214]MCX4804485.1 hypothetical protein [Streptomyces sp. NBC_01214]